MGDYNVYWGDSHLNIRVHQMEECEKGFEQARAHLDFFPVAYYPFAYEDTELRIETVRNRPEFLAHWERIIEAVHEYNESGRFITFPGYEWHGNRKKWGDHNIYFPDPDNAPLLDTWELPDLFGQIRELGGMAIPHHTGYQVGQRGKDWSFHDDDITPFTELYSGHGSSERAFGTLPMEGNHNMGPRVAGGSAVEGLNRGYRLGLIASGDNHGLYPGLYGKGLMGVVAPELTREALWKAFFQRRVYGVSGDRILLRFSSKDGEMGSVVPVSRDEPAEFQFSVTGNDEIERVELIKNGKIIDEIPHADRWRFPGPDDRVRWKMRIETGWGPSREHGFSRDEYIWKCGFEGPEILGIEECFAVPGNKTEKMDTNACEWRNRIPLREGGFRGAFNVKQSVVIEYRGTSEEMITVRGNNLEAEHNSREFARGPKLLYDFEASRLFAEETFEIDFATIENHDVIYHTSDKMRIMRALPEQAWTLNGSFTDTGERTEKDYYYIRVRQTNGHMAWSSPIWIKME